MTFFVGDHHDKSFMNLFHWITSLKYLLLPGSVTGLIIVGLPFGHDSTVKVGPLIGQLDPA